MMNEKQFQKKVEDFACLNCGHKVKGTGYTNHCPNCLFSRHVDKNPGDRKEECKGLMEPIAAEPTTDGYKIYHRCQNCGIESNVKSAPNDNFEIILELTTKPRREGSEPK